MAAEDRLGRRIADLGRQRDRLVQVGAHDTRVLLLRAVTRDTHARDQHTILEQRNAARRTIEPCPRNSATISLAKIIYVREREIRESNTHQRPRRAVEDTRREVLLDDKTGRARRESLLIAAEEDTGARLGNGDRTLARGDVGAAIRSLHEQRPSIAIDDRNHRLRQDIPRGIRRLSINP